MFFKTEKFKIFFAHFFAMQILTNHQNLAKNRLEILILIFDVESPLKNYNNNPMAVMTIINIKKLFIKQDIPCSIFESLPNNNNISVFHLFTTTQ